MKRAAADSKPASAAAARSWIARVFAPSSAQPAPVIGDSTADPLDAFLSEESAAAPAKVATPAPGRRSRPPSIPWAVAAVTAILVVSTVAAVRLRPSVATAPPPAGTVSVDTVPPGVPVAIDGQPRGVTPTSLSLSAGSHMMTLTNDGEQRIIPLTVTAGRESSQHYEFAPRAAKMTTGQLSVTSDAPGRVSVDGHVHGSTPIRIADLTEGEHQITFTSEGGTSTRTVTISAGATATATFSFEKPAGPAAGWISVAAPFDAQVFEGPDLIGSAGSKVMLAAGRHDVRIASNPLGYTENRRIDVVAGKVTAVKIEAPTTSLSVNARPWAEVTIDDADVGQTPLANVRVPIGTHVIVFRNPKYAEQRQTITVTLTGPNRIAADLTAK